MLLDDWKAFRKVNLLTKKKKKKKKQINNLYYDGKKEELQILDTLDKRN